MKDTPAFTWSNWWDYNKWFVIGGMIALLCAGQVVYKNVTQTLPDLQAAYVGIYPLSEEMSAQIETALEAVCTDVNNDGKVVVQLNQYPTAKSDDPDIALGQQAGTTRLMADLLDCESYLFLLEDADDFDFSYDILDTEWLQADLSQPFSHIEGMDKLTLARRTYDESRQAENLEDLDGIWQQLMMKAGI